MTLHEIATQPSSWVSPFHSDFLFLSAGRGLRGSGVFATVTLPAENAQHPDSLFRHAVLDALHRARQAGLRNPLVVGAIPFDTRQPSCLYVPQCHEWIEGAPAEAEEPDTAGSGLWEPPLRQAEPDRACFEAAVASALDDIGAGRYDKVVLSRTEKVRFRQPPDLVRMLRRLSRLNPADTLFRMPLADGGVLLGASPELLVRRQDDIVSCEPLAGSARRRPDDPDADRAISAALMRSSKDLHEHAVLVRQVQDRLHPFCARLAVPPTPTLRATSQMWHLASPLEGVLADPAPSALQLALLLHPTPAVCGHPTEAARTAIERLEPFDRGMFAGMVGWCDLAGNGEWRVTIRCGVALGRDLRLFAGAGIVAGSVPEAEWAETDAKLGTMRAVLSGPSSGSTGGRS